jgi:hypothetical protein
VRRAFLPMEIDILTPGAMIILLSLTASQLNFFIRRCSLILYSFAFQRPSFHLALAPLIRGEHITPGAEIKLNSQSLEVEERSKASVGEKTSCLDTSTDNLEG